MNVLDNFVLLARVSFIDAQVKLWLGKLDCNTTLPAGKKQQPALRLRPPSA
ncbi:hypothetical protein ACQ86E_04200 [Bradyrhizobium betae]|uniref:hypothetical protein n=1 Tax=Bradyrhizobium betae TaxID=244734 RepID=UPI003D67D857